LKIDFKNFELSSYYLVVILFSNWLQNILMSAFTYTEHL